MIGRDAESETRKAAAGPLKPAAGNGDWLSGFDRVAALFVLAFRGGDRQAHFLANGARQEPSQRMRLPGSCLE
jgi:hypothetical protein